MIVGQTLTDQDTDDPSQVAPPLDQIDDPIDQLTADGAYDGSPTPDDCEVCRWLRDGDPTRLDVHSQRGAGPTDVAVSPFGDDCRTRPPSLAKCSQLWSTLFTRNDNGLLHVVDRTAAASPRLCWPADRCCHRRRCAEPDVGGRTPGFRPSPMGHRVAAWDRESLRPRPIMHQHRPLMQKRLRLPCVTDFTANAFVVPVATKCCFRCRARSWNCVTNSRSATGCATAVRRCCS
jgi:hypothetical protein